MRQLIAGNWKMNGVSATLGEIQTVRDTLATSNPSADVLICPPATLISRAAELAKPVVAIGAQDCASEPFGAYTGDLSAEMLKDAGATAVIVGHSERRRIHRETGADVAGKARAANRAGLLAIVCIGETRSERDAGSALSVCAHSLAASVPDDLDSVRIAIAYEPVWAIGAGRTPSAEEILQMHAHIRACLERRFGKDAPMVRILYGGSMTPANAKTILSLDGVDGGLVGGASLRADDFLKIIRSAVSRD